MKIIIDDKIPYIQGAFEDVAEVVYLPGAKTTAEIVRDADAIITRTRTICNEELLAGSTVKFIATATIGYDHIDTDYCLSAGIQWTNAPGCNSKSVEQYIASSLMALAQTHNWDLSTKCIGIVGVGNVGSKVANLCSILGMKVLLNDPPRARAEQNNSTFVDIQTIITEADIISLHVPLNMKGQDATFHLADTSFFDALERKPVLINSCRGEVVETNAVKTALKTKKISSFVCDCWENEPDIDLELLALTQFATPHIAGYSKDGKAIGTLMSVQVINSFFSLGLNNWQPSGVELPEKPTIEIDALNLSDQEIITQAILHTYNIQNDDRLFKMKPADFEIQRGDYPTRREFDAYTIKIKNGNRVAVNKLEKIGFKVVAC